VSQSKLISPSQFISATQIDDAYDTLAEENKILRQKIQDLCECALANIKGRGRLAIIQMGSEWP